MALAPSLSVLTSSTNKKTALVAFLWENSDVFAWEASGLPGVPREVIEHKLVVNTDARPVKQVLRKQSKEKLEFIVSETDKLL